MGKSEKQEGGEKPPGSMPAQLLVQGFGFGGGCELQAKRQCLFAVLIDLYGLGWVT